eukprot:748095-Hanusia_phi.AAC.5
MEVWFDRLSVEEVAMAMEEEGLLEKDWAETIRAAMRRGLIAADDKNTMRALLLHYQQINRQRERPDAAATHLLRCTQASEEEQDSWFGMARRRSEREEAPDRGLYFMQQGCESVQRRRAGGEEKKRRGSETVRRREEAFKWRQTLELLSPGHEQARGRSGRMQAQGGGDAEEDPQADCRQRDDAARRAEATTGGEDCEVEEEGERS